MQDKAQPQVTTAPARERARERPTAAPTTVGPASELLSLQRSAGNAAVVGLLDTMGTAPADDGADVIRRKVGFEFEDALWRPWQKGVTDWGLGESAVSAKVDPVERKQQVHRGTGFTVEGDDTAGKNTPNLEFVTKPFDESAAGLDEFETTANQIRAIYTRIGPLRGKRGPGGGEPPWPYVPADHLLPAQHQLNGGPQVAAADVLLSGGHSQGMLKMQATTSGSLADITTEMEYFGAPGDDAAVPADRRTNAATAMRQDRPVAGPDRLLGQTPAIASRAAALLMAEVRGDPGWATSPDAPPGFAEKIADGQPIDPELVGFLATIILTLKGMQIPVTGPLKYRVPFMTRRNHAALFRMLDPAWQYVLGADDGSLLLAAVLQASNERAVLTEREDVGLGPDSPLVRPPARASEAVMATFAPLSSITVEIWLTCIVGGVDLLTPTMLAAWLKLTDYGEEEENEATLDLVESFGSLDNEPAAEGSAVFENRLVDPRRATDPRFPQHAIGVQDVDSTLRRAWNFLLFYERWTRTHTPGTFPNNPLGDRT